MDIVSPFLRVGLSDLFDRPDDAGVVHQNVDPFILGESRLHDLFNLFRIGDIAGHGDGPRPRAADLPGDSFDLIFAARAEDHGSAGLGQQMARGRTDSAPPPVIIATCP